MGLEYLNSKDVIAGAILLTIFCLIILCAVAIYCDLRKDIKAIDNGRIIIDSRKDINPDKNSNPREKIIIHREGSCLPSFIIKTSHVFTKEANLQSMD